MSNPHGWLTPDDPPGQLTGFCVYCPEGEDYEAVLRGALLPLCYAYNWEQIGTQTPEVCAQAFTDAMAETVRWERCMNVGSIVQYTGSTIPAHWLSCDGAQILIASYPRLYTVVGNAFGTADPGYFFLPDLRGRVVVGTGTGSGLTPRSLADADGEETHTLTEAEMPSHDHEIDYSADIAQEGIGIPYTVLSGLLEKNTSAKGSDDPHNNMQPFLSLHFIILAE